MKKIAQLSFVFLSLFAVASCSDDDTVDTEKPTIEIVSPVDHQEVEPGSSFTFKANLADNAGLASYKVEVHSAEDGHEHKTVMAKSGFFEYSVVKDVPNKAKNHTAEEVIPVGTDVTEGHYHVGITVLDVNGNQNQQFLEIFIGHEHEH